MTSIFLSYANGDLDGAMKLLKEEERTCRELGNVDSLQASLGNQALILKARGDLDGAMKLHKEEERICRELGNVDSLQISLGNQALILKARGDLDGAMALNKEQEQICRKLGNVDSLQISLGNQALILKARGDLDGAMALNKEQEQICRKLGNVDGLQRSLGNQANILYLRGDLDGAMALHKEAERICRELGNIDSLHTSLGNQANILKARGDLDGAMKLHKEEERICRELGKVDSLHASLGNQEVDIGLLDYEQEVATKVKESEFIRLDEKIYRKREVLDEEVKGKLLVDDYDIEKRVKIRGQDIKESEAGIELLQKMKAVKREDTTDYQAFELQKVQKTIDIEAQSVAVTSGSHRVISGSSDEILKVWDLENDREHATLVGQTGSINRVMVTMDNQQQMKENMSPVTGAIVKDSVITSSKVTKLDPINAAEKRSDPVHFTVTGPPQVKHNSSFILNIWAHLENQLIEVNKRAKESNANQPILVKTIGPHLIPQGIKIAFTVEIEDFIIDNREECVLWNGDIASANFLVKVPDSIESGVYGGTIRIFTDGISIARVNFLIEVNDSSSQWQLSDMPYDVFRYRKAFVSYSSKDRNQVLARIQGIQKVAPNLEIKMDIKDLRSGENWKEKLREFIDQCDIFYLFWSQNAKESPWVEKEWKCAYKHKGIDFIDPVPLESPEHVPPPSELSGKHFNDWVLAYVRTINS